MFASTEPAEKSLDESARKAIYADASRTQMQELPRTQNAIRQAFESLAALDEDHPYGQLAQLLQLLRHTQVIKPIGEGNLHYMRSLSTLVSRLLKRKLAPTIW